MAISFIDSHAHLTDSAFDTDREELITRILPEAQIQASVEIACATNEWQQALDLNAKYPSFIYPVLGVHPEYANVFSTEDATRLKELVKNPIVCAVGEIGLDYTCLEDVNKERQQFVFEQMIQVANGVQKPVVLHIRRQDEDFAAYEDSFHTLKHSWTPTNNRTFTGVLHCFCARYDEAVKALDYGMLLGINGCFTYKKNEYIREAIKKVGLEHVILETDCPYLSPQGKRGQRNDPSNIPLIAQYLADYLDKQLELVAEITTNNARNLYQI